MTRYGMVIDVSKCIGCYNCFLACRDEFAGNEYPGYSAAQPMRGMNWIKVIEVERGRFPKVKVNHVPVTCMHCEDAACLRLDQSGAVYRRADGIIMIDPERAKGNKALLNLCPYRVIEWNEERELPQKCTFCAHLLDQGEPEPRCVESCPASALTFGDLDDPESKVSRLLAAGNAVPMHPEYGLNDKVTYLNLPKKFVAGTVVYGDVGEVAAGIDVLLSGDGKELSTKTNGFGDFEFEGLAENVHYTVKIEASGYQPVTLTAKTSRDVYLGEIVLTK